MCKIKHTSYNGTKIAKQKFNAHLGAWRIA